MLTYNDTIYFGHTKEEVIDKVEKDKRDLADAKNHGKKSFGFLIDFSGRVLYHPSLPSPEDKNGKNPKFVDIKDLMILQSCDGIASSWDSSKGVDQTFIDEIRNSSYYTRNKFNTFTNSR